MNTKQCTYIIFVHRLVLEGSLRMVISQTMVVFLYFVKVTKLVNCMYRTETKVHSLSLKHYNQMELALKFSS